MDDLDDLLENSGPGNKAKPVGNREWSQIMGSKLGSKNNSVLDEIDDLDDDLFPLAKKRTAAGGS